MDSKQNSQINAKGRQQKDDPNAKAKDTISQIAIMVNMITLFIYEFFGQGEEVTVGVGVNMKTYFTAGYEDVGFWLLGAIIINMVALMVIGILNKK